MCSKNSCTKIVAKNRKKEHPADRSNGQFHDSLRQRVEIFMKRETDKEGGEEEEEVEEEAEEE